MDIFPVFSGVNSRCLHISTWLQEADFYKQALTSSRISSWVNVYICARLYKTHHSVPLHTLYFCNTHMHTHVKTHPHYKIKSKVKFSIIWHREFLLENGNDSLNKNHLVFYTYFQILSPSESVNLHATPPPPPSICVFLVCTMLTSIIPHPHQWTHSQNPFQARNHKMYQF